jgi:site-specific recombinase XerD
MRKVTYVVNASKGHKYIFINFNHDNGRFRKSTGIKISTAGQWNQTKRRLSGSHPQEFQGNRLLNLWESKIMDCYYASISKGIRLTNKILNEAIQPGKRQSKKEVVDFKTFLNKVIEKRKSQNFSKNTIKHYRQCLRMFEAYERHSRDEVHFDNLDRDMLTRFMGYLFNVRKNAHNSVVKHFQVISTMLKIATKEGIPVLNDYMDKEFQLSVMESDTIYLSLDELELLNTYQFNTKGLRNAVDLFLVGCFTLCRYQDYSILSMQNVRMVRGIEMIFLRQKKTIQPVVIPVHPILKAVLERNKGFPKSISMQKLNEYIKEACRVAGMNEKQMRYFNVGGKNVSEILEKWQRVSSHTARRSGATNLFIAGVDSQLIMKLTGHRKESTFRKYIRINNEEAAMLLAKTAFFSEPKK